MASINDWAAKAAERIQEECDGNFGCTVSVERIAAIIATFAEPLIALLQESRREHYHFGGDIPGTDCCPRCTCQCWPADPEPDFEPEPNSKLPCDCGADAWNARVEAVLGGRK